MIDRILFDCERLKYPNTGLFTFCEGLGHALIRCLAPHQKLTAYVPPEAINIFGNNVQYLTQRPWHKLFVPKSGEFDVWHSSNQVSRYYPSGNHTKIILTIHDLNFLVEKKHNKRKLYRILRQIQKRIDKATIIVCISHFVADQIRQYLDLRGKALHVIYNGCTVNDYPHFDNPRCRPHRHFLFTIGTILPKKNFHVLPALLEDNDYELIIAGNTIDLEYVDKIRNEASNVNVSDRVHIIGPISNEERSWYYRHCSAFVFPSIAEGFGLPPIEAMHYGKAVFLSTETSLPEIGADAAYYFKTFDPVDMRKVLKNGLNKFQIDGMEYKARRRAEQFNWNDTAKAYLKLYDSLISR